MRIIMNTSEKKGITTTTDQMRTGVVFNSEYLITTPGILKFIHVVLGIICVGITTTHFNYYAWVSTEMLFYLLMTTTFMIGSFINLLSCLVSSSNAPIMSKAVHEMIFHSVASGMLILAAFYLPIDVIRRGYSHEFAFILTESIIGLINALLYLKSAILARRTYNEMLMMDEITTIQEKTFLYNYF